MRTITKGPLTRTYADLMGNTTILFSWAIHTPGPLYLCLEYNAVDRELYFSHAWGEHRIWPLPLGQRRY